MNVKAYLTVKLHDKNGRVITRKRRLSRSFVIAWIDLIYEQCVEGAPAQPIKDTGNVSRNVNCYYNYNLYAKAGSTTSAYGIVVGSGTTPVAVSQYKLDTQIVHGTGAGQLFHNSMVINAPATSGSSRSFVLSRTFTNNSGGDVTVNECGLYQKGGDGSGYYHFLTIRDLFTQVVANGQVLTISYEIKATV